MGGRHPLPVSPRFRRQPSEPPASSAPFAIVPSDERALPRPTEGGFLVGAQGGQVCLVPLGSADILVVEVEPHQLVPIVAAMVLETGTTVGIRLIGLGR